MKKINLFLVILCSLVFFTACEDKAEIKTVDLSGVWINKTDATDTIVFINTWSEPAFEVKRGKEVKDDVYVPKFGNGYYLYEIKNDSIYVTDLQQSYRSYIIKPLSFHFTINKKKDEFSINGNFTNYPSDEMYFTYKKLK